MIELKIMLCILTLAVLLGIITVTPCCCGSKKCRLLGREYGIDCQRASELLNKMRCLYGKCCKK